MLFKVSSNSEATVDFRDVPVRSGPGVVFFFSSAGSPLLSRFDFFWSSPGLEKNPVWVFTSGPGFIFVPVQSGPGFTFNICLLINSLFRWN